MNAYPRRHTNLRNFSLVAVLVLLSAACQDAAGPVDNQTTFPAASDPGRTLEGPWILDDTDGRDVWEFNRDGTVSHETTGGNGERESLVLTPVGGWTTPARGCTRSWSTGTRAS